MGTRDMRYTGLAGGRFHRKAGFDKDLRPGELAGAVARAKQGDRDALRYIYLRFADNVYGYARSIVRDEHEAEDITQQVFARLITALKNYEQRSVPFSAWLLRIAHNMAIDHLRRRVTLCDEPDVSEARTDEQRGHELGLALRQALETLPDVQRQVLVMRHWVGCSPGEIAAALDRSEDSIHGLHHRGRRALREALAEVDAAPMTLVA
jgi:RNA polymerase sigma-70 factor (ECF subfamily)